MVSTRRTATSLMYALPPRNKKTGRFTVAQQRAATTIAAAMRGRAARKTTAVRKAFVGLRKATKNKLMHNTHCGKGRSVQTHGVRRNKNGDYQGRPGVKCPIR